MVWWWSDGGGGAAGRGGGAAAAQVWRRAKRLEDGPIDLPLTRDGLFSFRGSQLLGFDEGFFLSCHKSALREVETVFFARFYTLCYGVQAPLAGASPLSRRTGGYNYLSIAVFVSR